MSSPRRDTSGIQASEADPEGAVPKRPLLRRLIGTLGALRTSSAPGVRQAGSVLELCDTLLSERGEVSVALAAQTLQAYSRLDAAGRDVFFDLVAHRFLPD